MRTGTRKVKKQNNKNYQKIYKKDEKVEVKVRNKMSELKTKITKREGGE